MAEPVKSRVFLLTTVQLPEGTEALKRLIHSVEEQGSGQLQVVHYLLVQGDSGSNRYPSWLDGRGNVDRRVTANHPRMSLSAARNILLGYLTRDFASSVQENDVVGFPDDDAWYPSGHLRLIIDEINSRDLDGLICDYSSNPVVQPSSSHLKNVYSDSLLRLVRLTSSNGMFFRLSPIVSRALRFDEGLGVGTDVGGSEDLDFAMAVYSGAFDRRIGALNVPLIGHRDRDAGKRAEYAFSGIIVLRRYSTQMPLLWLGIVRKLLGVGYFWLRGALGTRDVLRVLSAVARGTKS